MECRLRPLVIKYSNITNPDGSALLCQGNTIVQVYVYGPVEVSSSKEHSDRASLFVAYKPKNSCNKFTPMQELYEDFLQKALKSVVCLDMHPRTSITIIIQEIQNDGCILSAALNGACCALLDAGIPMKSLITGVIFDINEKGEIFLDSNLDTSSECVAKLIIAYDSEKYNVISMINEGTISVDQIKSCLKIGRVASKEIVDFYHESMKKRFLIK